MESTTDFFFLISFVVWIVLGYVIYRKFYTSIDEIISTTEIRKSRAMQYRADQLESTLKTSIFFCVILSIGVNLVILQIYSWIFDDWPMFSYYFFLLGGVFILIAYPIGELLFLSEKESEAETPYHKVIRKVIRKFIGTVKGKVEAVILYSFLFFLIPILILFFGLNFDFLFSIFIVFMIYPLIIVGYVIAFAIFKLLTPLLFLHNLKNLRFIIGMVYIGITVLFEMALFLQNSDLIFFSLLVLLFVLIYGIIKGLKYYPVELTHIIDNVTRPFEYIHGSYLLLGFGLFTFLAQQTFQSISFIMVPTDFAALIEIIIIIQTFLIPIFLILIIYRKAKSSSRALVVALTYDSMKLNAAIKSRFIHDKTLIDSIEKSVNQEYIRPEYTPKLYRLLENTDVHVRRKAIILLRKITEDDRFKSVSIVPRLLDFLKIDKIWTVRLEAAESLTKMMQILPKVEVKNVFRLLSELDTDKNRYVRWGIIKVFNSIAIAREDKLEDVMPFLYKGLEDEEWSVRKGTVESFNDLIDNYPEIAIKSLGKSLKLLMDEDTDIIKEVFTLIHKIIGIEVNADNLGVLESKITEKLGSEYTFDAKMLHQAVEKIKEVSKPPKFVFKRSDLPRK